MFRVALNTALLNSRRNRRTVRIESLKDQHGNIPCEAGNQERHGRIRGLYEAIYRLPPLDRAIILLYLEQFSYREISGLVGISESNVSVRLVRTKKKLKELLA
jgi:RNA polymerase sigma-70 factor (ECF subfamily)